MIEKLTKQQFQKLPIKDQRIALAKDVIAHLAVEKFIPTNGVYFRFKGQDYIDAAHSAQDVIRGDAKCYVCAQGAVVCAFVANFNQRAVSELDEDDVEIVQIFGKPMWRELEYRFEGWHNRRRTTLSDLMNNIIDNNGELVFHDGLENGVIYDANGEATTDCYGRVL